MRGPNNFLEASVIFPGWRNLKGMKFYNLLKDIQQILKPGRKNDINCPKELTCPQN